MKQIIMVKMLNQKRLEKKSTLSGMAVDAELSYQYASTEMKFIQAFQHIKWCILAKQSNEVFNVFGKQIEKLLHRLNY